LRNRHPLSPLALAVLGVLHGGLAGAQEAAAPSAAAPAPAPALRPTPMLREQLPPGARGQVPTFVRGDRIGGQTELETTVEGNAELRKGDTVMRADRLTYDQATDLARARGNVRINKAGDVFQGPELELRLDAFEGFFTTPDYRFLRNDAYGQASRVDFIDEARMVVSEANYTTCQRGDYPGWVPAWMLRANRIAIDQDADEGRATNAVVSLFGVPVVPVPRLTFPLSERRKSGFLPPNFGVDTINGVDLRLPYYFDIAPNRDATLYPMLMTKRGVDLAGEFRYLERDYRGELRGNYLPGDQLRGGLDRWGYSWRHTGIVSPVPGFGSVNSLISLNRVSDDNYWRDFNRSITALTQRLLASDAQFSWARGYWGASARALKWQTLQDVTAPIVPPYDRLPQLQARHARTDLPAGLQTYVEADTTRFQSVPLLTTQPNAARNYLLARIERPWQAPGWFVTPRMQLHTRQYSFDAPLVTGETSAAVSVPTFSLDSGLVFERQASLFGRSFLQTLEPRAFYVYTPFRNQSRLPIYDTAAADFNFASIWSENAFVGNDRIADNSLLTVGASTRIILPESGAELARFGVAQRLRFQDQQVTLPGQLPVSERLSDILFGATLNWTPAWALDSVVQYDPKQGQSQRISVGGRYTPTPYRTLSVAYRLARGFSEQVDLGWQWPINDLWGDKGQDLGRGRGQGGGRWYTVGRINYSLQDRRPVSSLVGVEYDGCCWIGRVMLERLQNGTSTAVTRIQFQLELVGFSRLGSGAIGALRQNIPRYEPLRDPTLPGPSRFSNYD
jgi:LPS-assembly protein